MEGSSAGLFVHRLVLVLVLLHPRLHLAPETADLLPGDGEVAGKEAKLLDEGPVGLEREVLHDVVHDLVALGEGLPDAEAKAYGYDGEGALVGKARGRATRRRTALTGRVDAVPLSLLIVEKLNLDDREVRKVLV